MSSALSSMPTVVGSSPRMPSGPGWLVARVSTMNCSSGGSSSPVPAVPSGPRVTSGSSGCSGMNTVPLPPFCHQVEAVVEELAEEHEPQVERRRQARVRRDVVERELGDVVNRAQYAVQTRPSPG